MDPIARPPVPWTQPYVELRGRTLAQVVRDTDVLERFATGSALPEGFGRGLDERCVEYPWLVAHLFPSRARVLDAGSTLNHSMLLELPVLADKHLHIVTLAPEQDCFWQRRVSYLFEDLRELPFKDDYYDIVIATI